MEPFYSLVFIQFAIFSSFKLQKIFECLRLEILRIDNNFRTSFVKEPSTNDISSKGDGGGQKCRNLLTKKMTKGDWKNGPMLFIDGPKLKVFLCKLFFVLKQSVVMHGVPSSIKQLELWRTKIQTQSPEKVSHLLVFCYCFCF